MENKGKFLVEFIDRFGNQKGFFAVWLLVVAVFCWLIWSHLKSTQKRNFREKPYRPNWKTSRAKAESKELVRSEEDGEIVKVDPK